MALAAISRFLPRTIRPTQAREYFHSLYLPKTAFLRFFKSFLLHSNNIFNLLLHIFLVFTDKQEFCVIKQHYVRSITMLRRLTVYFLLNLAAGVFISFFASWYYLRSESPRSPDPLTRNTIARRMQQSYPVYLKPFQNQWIDYSLPGAMVLFFCAWGLNQKWKIIRNRHEELPELTRKWLNKNK